ncbi:MAG: hypothetical protein NW701_05935 [Nitrospira sp.]
MRYHPLPKTAVSIVAMATMGVVLWIGWGSWRHPAALWAPGDLSRYHADIASCTQCHEAFRGPSQARCIVCHSNRYFERRSPAASAALHRDMMAQRTACSACHTEHRGALAQITNQARMNPHGEFVFLATGARSCSACHDFGARVADRPTLKDDPLVTLVRKAGGTAHQPGKMADCLKCHGIGKNEE